MDIVELDKVTNDFCKSRPDAIDYAKVIDILKDIGVKGIVSGGSNIRVLFGDENYIYILNPANINISKAKEDAEAFEWKV